MSSALAEAKAVAKVVSMDMAIVIRVVVGNLKGEWGRKPSPLVSKMTKMHPPCLPGILVSI